MVMSGHHGWRYVKVPLPDPLAAIGGALRHAFAMTGELRCHRRFAELLPRLR